MLVHKDDFGPDFKWGVSTAAYQIEGGYNQNGKGLSIWDDFVDKKNKIFNNDHGKVACDFYNNYAKDISMISTLQIPNYRFSIAWTRIFPHGIGVMSHEGIDFYNRVIDLCLELNIEPWITLYHWDLPLELQRKGGWTNREIIHWFSFYVDSCVKYFGDRVKNWIVLNEPMVFSGAGYFLGIHAPGKKGLNNFLSTVHHASICQSEGGRIIKQLLPGSNVGTTFSCSHIEPYRNNDRDIKAAKKVDALLNRLFIEPLLGRGYPVCDLKILERIEKFIKPRDEGKLAFDMDFFGIQNYTRELVCYAQFMPFIRAKIMRANKRDVEATLMNWEVYPPSIYYCLKKFASYPNIKELIITESGAAFNDTFINGVINDEKRIKYLQDHIAQVLRAKKEGVPVNGFFVWTLLDNFEWAEGFNPKFGLVHVDFATQKRTVKNSGKWYRQFLQNKAIVLQGKHLAYI
ncbi:MAG: GH1 family beta-glucosidase [Ginsengibacter sp.]